MIIIMKKNIHIILLLIVILSGYEVFAAECTLSTVPSPPIDAYAKNIETILEAAKTAAADTECTRTE